MSFMRLSLMKAAHVALSGAAKQEIRVRFGRDDKGEGDGSIKSGCWTEAFFITLGGPQAHGYSGRDDKFVEPLTAVPGTGTECRVPHISLVFCEMWVTATLRPEVFRAPTGYDIEVRGIPHLAKNERDVGHPALV